MNRPIDFLHDPLGEILLGQNAELERLERLEEAIMAVENWIALNVSEGRATIEPQAMLRLIGEVRLYADTGRRPMRLDLALSLMDEKSRKEGR